MNYEWYKRIPKTRLFKNTSCFWVKIFLVPQRYYKKFPFGMLMEPTLLEMYKRLLANLCHICNKTTTRVENHLEICLTCQRKLGTASENFSRGCWQFTKITNTSQRLPLQPNHVEEGTEYPLEQLPEITSRDIYKRVALFKKSREIFYLVFFSSNNSWSRSDFEFFLCQIFEELSEF
jgi:hypothetical protein